MAKMCGKTGFHDVFLEMSHKLRLYDSQASFRLDGATAGEEIDVGSGEM